MVVVVVSLIVVVSVALRGDSIGRTFQIRCANLEDNLRVLICLGRSVCFTESICGLRQCHSVCGSGSNTVGISSWGWRDYFLWH